MVGADVAKKLFPTTDPIGHEIFIDGEQYTIVGVGKAIGSVMGQPQDNYVYIPVQTWFKTYGMHTDRITQPHSRTTAAMITTHTIIWTGP